jgi:UDP-N-acetylglucosamine 2-epimerase (non-hydrolysing)
LGKIKVLSVFGTRPEAIKMAPLVGALKNVPDEITSVVAVTAQHREMLDQVLSFFNIHPDYDLNIMQRSQSLTEITVRVLEGLERILAQEKFDFIFVHGDTTTTFAAALAAFYRQIPIGHVEAGLRSGEKYSPFPEEVNRRLAGVLTDLHFAPTKLAKENLLREGVKEEQIFVTGNTVIDALFATVKRTPPNGELWEEIDRWHERILLVEAHRRENIGEPMQNICEAIGEVAQRCKDVRVVFPVHKNPKVRETVEAVLGGKERIHLLEPQEYPHFAKLMEKSYLILTDSGGIQEEAPSLGKPVLVLREVTEREEAVEAGTVKLVGRNRERIVENAMELLNDERKYRRMSQAKNPYGDGTAALRIVDGLLYYFGKKKERPEDYLL